MLGLTLRFVSACGWLAAPVDHIDSWERKKMHLCSFLKPHAGLVLVSLVCAGANGATIVAPASLTSIEGNGGGPIAWHSTGQARTYQLQYSPTALGGMTTGTTIKGLSFRLNGGSAASPASAGSFTDYNITLAEATTTIAARSATFAANMANPVLVRSGALSVGAGSFPGGATPNAFGMQIPFTTPYVYQGGDLVIHITHNGTSNGALTLDLDANSATGYGVHYRASSFSSFNAVAADNPSFAAAIVRLETEIPEPATLSLIGLTGLMLVRRRK
jgi:hypothetical protein